MTDGDRPVTKADLDALRAELREALLSAMDQILNAVHSVAPPLGGKVQMTETRLNEHLDAIEKQQAHLATAVERLRAEVASLGDRVQNDAGSD